MSGTNDNTEEIKELADFLRAFADANDGGEFETEQCEKLRKAADEIDRLRAENATLKAQDPLAEMWRELESYQPQADADGHGESWRRMCEARTKQAARDAGSAAHAVAVASRTQLAKLAALDARDSTLFAGWASGNYVEGLKSVAEDGHSAIAAIRRAKEAKP
jgi:hypothetical protein